MEHYNIPSCYQELQRRMNRERTQLEFKVEDHHDQRIASIRQANLRNLRSSTSYIWVLDKKPEKSGCPSVMPLNPESASDIAKISPYLPCIVARRLAKPFLFKGNSCVITMMTIVEDFKNLTMSLLSKAQVRFYPTQNYYQGSQLKARFHFEYNKRLRELLSLRFTA